ncbi:HlyC/CorC family transporter, partial [bacterium]|nr:HlyC/CorC family transporter [bacterium]
MKSILFILFLVLSAFFSGSETALFSLSKLKLQHLRDLDNPAAKRVLKLLEQPQHLLITILTGNTLVNVSASTIAALLTADLCLYLGISHHVAIILEIGVMVGLLLILGEITPKFIAIKNAVQFSQRISALLTFFSYLLLPVTWVLVQFNTVLARNLGVKEIGVFFSQDELKTLIEVSEQKGAIEEDEKEMIHSIFEFGQTSVREVMVPRIDMVCVETGTHIEELISIINTRGKTRIPLFRDRIDNILGIVHAKDLLPYISPNPEQLSTQPIDLLKLARPVQFVPENKKIDDLLRDFQRDKIHLAIVVDEYGGTAGLVTLEDIIEEIVGEIQDEYDFEGPLIRKLDNNTYTVDGKTNVSELEEILEIPFPTSESYDTVAGLIFDHTGYVPKEKEVIEFEYFDTEIEKIDRNRIVMVKLHLKDVP